MKLVFLSFFLLTSFSLSADQNDQRLNILFNLLQESKEEIIIDKITKDIWKIWHETNDPFIDSDFYKGIESMNSGNFNMAIAFFTSVIEKKPDFAEAWNKRATLYYLIGDYDSSMLDINETLKLEPRHFGAMDGMALIFITQENYNKVIDVYNKMLEIFPNSLSIQNKKEKILKIISNSA